MYEKSRPFVVLALGLLIAASCAGCGSQDALVTTGGIPAQGAQADGGHDGNNQSHADDAPKDFASGVELLKGYHEQIKGAFTEPEMAAAIEKAHDPLHHIGMVLEALPGLAKSADLTSEQLDAVKAATKVMLDGYGQIDGAIHHNETPDYQAVADKLDEAMAALIATPKK